MSGSGSQTVILGLRVTNRDPLDAKKYGDAGYRSRYLSHAKRALYHLSYTPLSPLAGDFSRRWPPPPEPATKKHKIWPSFGTRLCAACKYAALRSDCRHRASLRPLPLLRVSSPGSAAPAQKKTDGYGCLQPLSLSCEGRLICRTGRPRWRPTRSSRRSARARMA
eukprot:COSAG04_NODE_524_length_13127_cov_18.191511_22_plen_165_part_00